jgi:hypothetical protein
MKLYTYDPQKNKRVFVGNYNEYNKCFIKRVNSKHFMRIENGYGIQEDIIQLLKNKNCQEVKIIPTDAQIIISKFEDWLKKPIKNYGSGFQRFMEVKKC